MSRIYKSFVPEYKNEDIPRVGTLSSFVSFERLIKTSIQEAIKLKPTEKMIGMVIDFDGITIYLERIKTNS